MERAISCKMNEITGESKKFTRLEGCEIKSMWPIFKIKVLIYQSKANLDCVHTMPAHFENGEKFDG